LTLRFASLGSGSRGNALLVETGDMLVMIDCGLTRSSLEERFKAVQRDPRDLSAVLITHEHGDHSQGVVPFLRRYAVPVWATPGTAGAIPGLGRRHGLNCHRPLTIGALAIEPFPVPHDAREPCQFVFCASGRRLGVLTDTGHITPAIVERLGTCDALAVECNHDLEMLRNGAYPESVKTRVASRYGHLNNGQSAQLIAGIQHPGLQWVVGLHLSERNNSPQRARAALESIDGRRSWSLHFASQDAASDWHEIA
jgi:phosphoribosyl 1,2-cyclic phosphodiesterase